MRLNTAQKCVKRGPRITKFYRCIRTDSLCTHIRYDVTNYSRSEVIVVKQSKIPPLMALGGISWERFKRGSPNFTHLSRTISLTKLLDTISLAASGRLQNAIKYCTKVCKIGAAGNESNNSATVHCRIIQFYTYIPTELIYTQISIYKRIYSKTGYDVISYFRSAFLEVLKTPENATSTALGRIFVARRFACHTNWLVSCWLFDACLQP